MGLFDDLLEDDSTLDSQAGINNSNKLNSFPQQKQAGLFDDLLQEPEEEVGTLQGIANTAQNALDSSRQALLAVGGVNKDQAEQISKLEYAKQARKAAPGYADYQKAEGWDAVGAFVKNPVEVTTNIIGEGLAGSLPALGAGLTAGAVGAAVGSAAPVVGTGAGYVAGQVLGTFGGSLSTEYGSKILEELQNAGMDISDPNSIQNYFSDEEKLAPIRDKALQRGVPIAAFDALSAGIGGKLGRVFGSEVIKEGEKVIGKQFATKTGEALTELGAQAILGGGGEVAGSVAAGDEVNLKDVFAEVVGEVGPGSIEVIQGRMADRANQRKLTEAKANQNILNLSETLEQNSSPLTAKATQDELAKQLSDELNSDREKEAVELANIGSQTIKSVNEAKAETQAATTKEEVAANLSSEDLDLREQEATKLVQQYKDAFFESQDPNDRSKALEFQKVLDAIQAEKQNRKTIPTEQASLTQQAVAQQIEKQPYATQEIIQPESVRAEPQDRNQIGEKPETIIGDSLRNKEEGIKELIRNRDSSIGATYPSVLNGVENLEVAQSVVSSLPVDVVNLFGGKEGTSQVLLNNPSMLKDSLFIFGDANIPRLSGDSYIVAVANLRAKLLDSLSAGGNKEFISALGAANGALGKIVGTPSLGGGELGREPLVSGPAILTTPTTELSSISPIESNAKAVPAKQTILDRLATIPFHSEKLTERKGKASIGNIIEQPPVSPQGTRVASAAYIAPDNTVYYGASHLDAMQQAVNEGKIAEDEVAAKQAPESRETPQFGYKTDADPFVTRDQAEGIAKQSGQMLVKKTSTGQLHSNEVALDEYPKTISKIPETGKPFEFFSVRNTEKAPQMGTQFGQDIEPSGKYISESTPNAAKNLDERFEKGTVRFENPLVINFGGEYGTETNWKNVLSSQYGGKKGAELSQAVRDAGYDGIVTLEPAKGPNRPAATSEIVDIRSFKPTSKQALGVVTPAQEVVTPTVAETITPVSIAEAIVSESAPADQMQVMLQEAENAPTREIARQIGRDAAMRDPSLPPPAPIEYEILQAISDRANRKGYNSEILTEENINLVKDAGFVTKTKIPKITEAGRNIITDGAIAARNRDMALGDISDRLSDQTVAAWDAKNDPTSAAAIAQRTATTPAVSETITPPAPSGLRVGQRVRSGSTPQPFVITEVTPQTAREVELGEQYYKIKNERTGEESVVESVDIKPIKKTASSLYKRKKSSIAQEVEKISETAMIDKDGSILSAPNKTHAELMEQGKFNLDDGEFPPSENFGFITNKGRFVLQKEAQEIAKKSKQIEGAQQISGEIVVSTNQEKNKKQTKLNARGASGNKFNESNFKRYPGVAISRTNSETLTSHPLYNAAKKFNNVKAAKIIVDDFVDDQMILDVFKSIDTNKPAYIVPVLKGEGDSMNMLPIALAEKLSNASGIPVWGKLFQATSQQSTGAGVNEKVEISRKFMGEAPPEGSQIIIVDDYLSTGRTIASLENMTGTASSVSTIATGRYGNQYGLTSERAEKMLQKANITRNRFYEIYGKQPEQSITGVEAQTYILNGSAGESGFTTRFPVEKISPSNEGIKNIANVPQSITLFSGGGLFELGVKGIVKSGYAVEADQRIAEFYEEAHGVPVIQDYVQNVKFYGINGGHLHASPVCKNFSTAKNKKQVTDLDKIIDRKAATAVAQAIKDIQPKTISIENVTGYKDTESYNLIISTLEKNGYIYDANFYNANDFGAPTSRKRLIIRAVKKGGILPEVQKKKKTISWYDSVKDIVNDLPNHDINAARYPAKMMSSLKEKGIDLFNVDKPLLISGTDGKTFRSADQPAMTFLATPKSLNIIALPGGIIKKVTARAMARMTGVPDSFPLPDDESLAKTIVGNGIPPALTRNVIGDLILQNEKSLDELNKNIPEIRQARAEYKSNTQSIDIQRKVNEYLNVNLNQMEQAIFDKDIDLAQEIASKINIAKNYNINDSELYTMDELVKGVSDFFNGSIPENVVFIDDIGDDSYGAYNTESGIIEINRAHFRQGKKIAPIIAHELGHYAFGDPVFRKIIMDFWDSLSIEDRNIISSYTEENYSDYDADSINEEKLIAGWQKIIENNLEIKSAWEKFVQSIKEFFNKVFFNGKFTPKNENKFALDVLNSIRQEFISGRKIPRTDGSNFTFQSKATQVHGNKKVGNIISQVPEFFSKTDKIISDDIFNKNEITEENIDNAWFLLGSLRDQSFARSINEQVLRKMDDSELQELNRTVGVQRLKNSLKQFGIKLLSQGNPSFNNAYNKSSNTLSNGLLSDNDTNIATTLAAKQRILDQVSNAHEAQSKGEKVQTAATLFGTSSPSKEQINAVEDALDTSEKVEVENIDNILDGVVDVETRTGLNVRNQIDKAISKSKPKQKNISDVISSTETGRSEFSDISESQAKSSIKSQAASSIEMKAERAIEGLARLQSDTQEWPNKTTNEVRTIIQQDLRQRPDMGRKDAWKSMLTAKLMQAGVSESKSIILSDLIWKQHEINSMNQEIKLIESAAENGSLGVIVELIKNTPLKEQSTPEWRKGVILRYLKSSGLSEKQAETAAKLYDSIISEKIAEAKQKAFEDSISKTSPWRDHMSRNGQLAKGALKKVLNAVRTSALDPTQNTESIIAKQNGWTGFSKEDFQRISEIDDILNNKDTDQLKKAEVMKELNGIISKTKLPVTIKQALAAYYTGQALMGVPTVTVNVFSPLGFSIRNLFTDIARFGATDPIRIPIAFDTFLESMRSWYNQTKYAFKNEVYPNDVVEYLNGNNVLKELFNRGKSEWKKGNYASGMRDMLIGSTQITGRVLSALDQGAISSLENQAVSRYALEAMSLSNIPRSQRNAVAKKILQAKRNSYASLIASGMESDRAGVLSDIEMKNDIKNELSSLNISSEKINDVINSSINDALLAVGRNRTLTMEGLSDEQKRLSDNGMISYLPIKFLEQMASNAAQQGPLMQIFSKMLYGFALVPARTFHNAAWYSPYGFLRIFRDKYQKAKGMESSYALSLGNELQYRQRLTESIAGSVAMLGLAALAASSTDDDDDRKLKIVVTGNGPDSTADKQYYDSWNKKWKPNSIHIVIGDTIIPINIGRGGEAVFFPIMLAGAFDDWQIRNKMNKSKKNPADLNQATVMLGSAFLALAQRGPYAAFGKSLFNAQRAGQAPQELASQVGYMAKTFVPVLGTSLARNISDFINDPIDRSSMSGALYSNIPIVGPMIGTKALNAFGQPIRADDLGDRLFKLGVPMVFSFPKNTPENELNELVLQKGDGPTIPTRRIAESRVGRPLTNDEFYMYVKTYGDSVSKSMFTHRRSLERMDVGNYESELLDYAKKANERATRSVKRMSIK